MTTLKSFALAMTACLLAMVAGCASRPEQTGPTRAPTVEARPAASLKDDLPPEVARQGELAVMLAKKLRGARSCAAVGSELESFTQSHRAELKATQAALIRWEQGASAAELKAFYKDIFPAIEVRIDAGIRCKDDRGVRLAFDRFFAATGLDGASR